MEQPVPLVAVQPPRRRRERVTKAEELAINMTFADEIVASALSGKTIAIEVVREEYCFASMGRLSVEQVRAKVRNIARARAARLAAAP